MWALTLNPIMDLREVSCALMFATEIDIGNAKLAAVQLNPHFSRWRLKMKQYLERKLFLAVCLMACGYMFATPYAHANLVDAKLKVLNLSPGLSPDEGFCACIQAYAVKIAGHSNGRLQCANANASDSPVPASVTSTTRLNLREVQIHIYRGANSCNIANLDVSKRVKVFKKHTSTDFGIAHSQTYTLTQKRTERDFNDRPVTTPALLKAHYTGKVVWAAEGSVHQFSY